MADDLKLSVVIQALLDSKGFEEAKARIQGVASQAAAVTPTIVKSGEAVKKMGESYGGTRGPIADVTRVLLMNVGVTGAAGEAAKAAGTAMYFMEGAATAASVAINAGVAAIAFGLPLLIQWFNSTKEQKVEQVELKKAIDETLPLLERYAAHAKIIGEAARLQLRESRVKAFADESEELQGLLREEADLQSRLAQARQLGASSLSILEDKLDKTRGRIMDLRDAHAQGMTVEQLYEARIREDTDAQQAATKAIEDRKRAQDALNKSMEDAFEEGRIGRTVTRQRSLDAALEKDAKKLAEREKKQRDSSMSDELQDLLVFGDRKLQAQRQLDEDERELNRQTTNAKKDAALGAAAQIAGSLSIVFGKNKAMAIAAAIIDTYSAANQVLRDPSLLGTPFLRWTLAAAAIATGMANVQMIREQDVGFDDPFADLTARRLGRRSAEDFAKHFGGEFVGRLPGAMMRQGGVTNHYTINRGTTNHITANGIIGSRTEFRKWLGREMVEADRVESHRTVGRS